MKAAGATSSAVGPPLPESAARSWLTSDRQLVTTPPIAMPDTTPRMWRGLKMDASCSVPPCGTVQAVRGLMDSTRQYVLTRTAVLGDGVHTLASGRRRSVCGPGLVVRVGQYFLIQRLQYTRALGWAGMWAGL